MPAPVAAGTAVAGGAKGVAGRRAGAALRRGAGALHGDGERGPLETLVWLVVALLTVLFVVSAVIVASLTATRAAVGGEPEARPAGSEIPQEYWPMYTAAARRYRVSPYLLASIHRQESAFSTNPAVRQGANGSGAMGPMQFLAGTWARHKRAFRPIAEARPSSYPLNRRELPSCAGVPTSEGCVYDDFDAIAAAASYLAASGADTSLASAGTHRAVCAYIGACGEVDDCTGSINQYCEVLPRARRWELEGAAPVAGAGAEAAVSWALLQEGTSESPRGADCGGPIGDWQRRAGSTCGWPWCGVFVHEAYRRAGIDLPDAIASVPATLTMATAGRPPLRLVAATDIRRGDIVIFQWDDGPVDHMGLATASYRDGSVTTVEGNTSDGVHQRVRYAATIVAGVRVLGSGA
jgi:hypothetical protein